jgi:hypothetical protein
MVNNYKPTIPIKILDVYEKSISPPSPNNNYKSIEEKLFEDESALAKMFKPYTGLFMGEEYSIDCIKKLIKSNECGQSGKEFVTKCIKDRFKGNNFYCDIKAPTLKNLKDFGAENLRKFYARNFSGLVSIIGGSMYTYASSVYLLKI